MRLPLVYHDPPEIVILKKGSFYHAVVAEPYRVKNLLTMQRPMPTVITALEHLLDVTAEHLANVGQLSADCATPPGQWGEMVENDLWINRGTLYVPSLTASVTSGSGSLDSEEESESSESGSSEPTSMEESPPPVYSRLPVADRLPTPFASPTGRGSRGQVRRRPASAMGDTDEDDTSRGNTLRRSTRIRRSYGQS